MYRWIRRKISLEVQLMENGITNYFKMCKLVEIFYFTCITTILFISFRIVNFNHFVVDGFHNGKLGSFLLAIV